MRKKSADGIDMPRLYSAALGEHNCDHRRHEYRRRGDWEEAERTTLF